MRRNAVLSVILLSGCIVSAGCSFHGVRNETGNPIAEANVQQIVNGKSTATDILGLFGAPTHTSTLGPNEVYVYKNCKTGGAGVSVLGLGHTGMTERCNSLSVTIDKGSGVVQSYNYQKMFDAD